MSNDFNSDLDKLKQALSSLSGKFSSVQDILESFGLANLPTAQRYGILFGICVFTLTITAVLMLLIYGGTFARIQQESKGNNKVVVPEAVRKSRPLLLERLLEARDRMLAENYPPPPPRTKSTPLTEMLLNVNYNGNKQQQIPEGYEETYKKAYLTCQDKPGGTSTCLYITCSVAPYSTCISKSYFIVTGATLSGRPEARFEAYARAYAGCGIHTSTDYRRSYARLYEATVCKTVETDQHWQAHFERRPQDVIGRTVLLQALDDQEHGEKIHAITCGNVHSGDKAFDPNKLWAFRSCGPFESAQDLMESEIFTRRIDEAAFAIVDNVTQAVIGIAMLVNDDARNLTIQMEPPIVKPSMEENPQQLEACFLLMDRLFAHGYRRISMSVDAQDVASKQLARRLGFTQEGFFPKSMIVKEANRDSWVYGMINTDWNKGARAALFQKLHGAKMQRADAANSKKEAELEEQNSFLKRQKEKEQATAKKKKV